MSTTTVLGIDLFLCSGVLPFADGHRRDAASKRGSGIVFRNWHQDGGVRVD
jgi:hypothetical protein